MVVPGGYQHNGEKSVVELNGRKYKIMNNIKIIGMIVACNSGKEVLMSCKGQEGSRKVIMENVDV